MITIVAAGPDDATEILAIQLRAFEAEARLVDNRDIPPMTETIESVIDQIELTRVLKAVDGQRILGSIRGVMSDNVCTIQRLSIALDCQGLGLGSALLAAIEQQHPQASGFELITNRAMDANVRFYQRHGYRVVGTIHHSDKISLVRMGKRNSASHAVGPEMTSTTHDEAGRP